MAKGMSTEELDRQSAALKDVTVAEMNLEAARQARTDAARAAREVGASFDQIALAAAAGNPRQRMSRDAVRKWLAS